VSVRHFALHTGLIKVRVERRVAGICVCPHVLDTSNDGSDRARNFGTGSGQANEFTRDSVLLHSERESRVAH
jgi:hypothetical protein